MLRNLLSFFSSKPAESDVEEKIEQTVSKKTTLPTLEEFQKSSTEEDGLRSPALKDIDESYQKLLNSIKNPGYNIENQCREFLFKIDGEKEIIPAAEIGSYPEAMNALDDLKNSLLNHMREHKYDTEDYGFGTSKMQPVRPPRGPASR